MTDMTLSELLVAAHRDKAMASTPVGLECIGRLREVLFANDAVPGMDVQLLAETMRGMSCTSGDHHMLAYYALTTLSVRVKALEEQLAAAETALGLQTGE